MDGSSVARGGSAAQSPTSPASSRQGNGAPKRKRSTGVPAHLESSPNSPNDDHDDDHADGDKKRQPGVKRACNECRQQKVSQPTTRLSLSASRLPPPASRSHCALSPNCCPSASPDCSPLPTPCLLTAANCQ